MPIYLRSSKECVDEDLFEKYSFELIKSSFSYIDFKFYERWKNGDITLEEFAQLQTGFMRSVTQSILEETLKINEKRSEENIDQLLKRFWEIYSEQVKQNADQFQIRSYQTYLILKKL